jgi:hypothetical protein
VEEVECCCFQVLLANKANTAVPQQTFILFNFFALTTFWQHRIELAGLLLFVEGMAQLFISNTF